MTTLWPFNVHTSTSNATHFNKYLSQDETYQGMLPPSVFTFRQCEGHSWAHTELWEHPPPLTHAPPLTKSPGSGQRARWGEWCEWKASQQGIFSDQSSNKLGNWSRIWFNAELNIFWKWIQFLHCTHYRPIAFNILIRDSCISDFCVNYTKCTSGWHRDHHDYFNAFYNDLNMTHWPNWWLLSPVWRVSS